MAADAQDETYRIQLESVLHRFKNYRFSNISIYEVKDVKDVRNAIKSKEEQKAAATAGGDADAECVQKADKSIVNFVKNQVKQGNTKAQIQRNMFQRNMMPPPEFDCIYQYYKSQERGAERVIRNAYIITTRKSQAQIVPPTIIALIVTLDDEEDLKKNIDRPSPSDVYTAPELEQIDINSEEFGAETMRELIVNAFRQNNVKDITLEAQGIGTLVQFAPKEHGVTESLIANESDIKPENIQTFMRISEGQPMDYYMKKNEVILSPDLISWRRYDVQQIEYSDGYVDTLSRYTNKTLPKFGVEMRYGIEDINYPSIWSERVTANAVWQNVKMGIILPTSGWSSISKDAFNLDRKFTYAGVGISGRMDFPILVIPESGIFHASFDYVFGDAQPAEYKDRDLDPDTFTENIYDRDYLIRYDAQLHYTFGVQIDDNYLMRFGIGGTVYNVEKWYHTAQINEETLEREVVYEMLENETIGGVSGKLEFMVKDITTPYGASIQYFDEALYTNAWLQIPIVDNTLALRLDAKGYFTAFRDMPHEWENESVFVPMARVIVTF
jgi:hypothetical protein